MASKGYKIVVSDEDEALRAWKQKGDKEMDNIILTAACLMLTVVFGVSVYGAVLNAI